MPTGLVNMKSASLLGIVVHTTCVIVVGILLLVLWEITSECAVAFWISPFQHDWIDFERLWSTRSHVAICEWRLGVRCAFDYFGHFLQITSSAPFIVCEWNESQHSQGSSFSLCMQQLVCHVGGNALFHFILLFSVTCRVLHSSKCGFEMENADMW